MDMVVIGTAVLCTVVLVRQMVGMIRYHLRIRRRINALRWQ